MWNHYERLFMFRTRIKNFVYPLLFMALAGGFVAAIHFLKNFGFDRMVARVEEAVVQEPDSAISMLDSLSAGFLTEEEAALYALLYTEAVFEKEHHIHDSTLQVAYAYFVEEGKGDIPRELTVKLYYGLGLLEEGKQVEAFFALLDVYEQREALPGMHQKNLLCRYLGEIYRRNALYQEAERRFGEDSLGGLAERGERAEGTDARLAKDVAVAEMRFEREGTSGGLAMGCLHHPLIVLVCPWGRVLLLSEKEAGAEAHVENLEICPTHPQSGRAIVGQPEGGSGEGEAGTRHET